MKRNLKTWIAAIAFGVASVGGALAQSGYPDRPIKWIVPFPAGGSADAVPRMSAQRLSPKYNIVIENRTGAGGNIGAGKWNDGSPPYRQILADRLAAGLEKAWDSTVRSPVDADDLGWGVEPTALPLGEHVVVEELEKRLADPDTKDKPGVAKVLTWARRCQAGETIDIQCLRIGKARVLHMPGELCVEYQLAAQEIRKDLFVAMAAYGEYATGYICTEIAYTQGGYEGSKRASHVAPQVESVLTKAMRKLLED